MSQDSWESTVDQWCRQQGEFIRLEDVITQALGFDPRQVQRPVELRAGRVLRSLGYVKVNRRIGEKVTKAWTLDPLA